MTSYICPSCGVGTVEPARGTGRRWHYKTIRDLELPEAVELPTCSSCGEVWIDEAAAERLGEVLEPVYRAALVGKVEKSIDVLRSHHGQRTVEKRLGLSAGYLSKLRQEARAASPALVAALMLLAEHPELVGELEDLWSVSAQSPAEGQSTSEETIDIQGSRALERWLPAEPKTRRTETEVIPLRRAA